MSQKKVMLITPPYHCGVVEVAGTWMPLTLCYLAAHARNAGFDVRIYDAQLAILHDKTFRKDVEDEVSERKANLEVALQRVIARYEGVFEAMENAAMRERAASSRAFSMAPAPCGPTLR